eukprot:197809-Amphidinium_carterae.2
MCNNNIKHRVTEACRLLRHSSQRSAALQTLKMWRAALKWLARQFRSPEVKMIYDSVGWRRIGVLREALPAACCSLRVGAEAGSVQAIKEGWHAGEVCYQGPVIVHSLGEAILWVPTLKKHHSPMAADSRYKCVDLRGGPANSTGCHACGVSGDTAPLSKILKCHTNFKSVEKLSVLKECWLSWSSW